MKFRRSDREHEQIKLNMTAMIDIVFQLLVFFIWTFKIVEMEGDFNVKMPLAAENVESIEEITPEVIRVVLNAGPEGRIASIEADNGFDGQTFLDEDMYTGLTEFVERSLAGEGDPSIVPETEVEFDIAYNLKYSYTVRAIEAVSGKVLPGGNVKKLVEKIKFKDNTSQRRN